MKLESNICECVTASVTAKVKFEDKIQRGIKNKSQSKEMGYFCVSDWMSMSNTIINNVCYQRWLWCRFLFSSWRRMTQFDLFCHSTRRAYLRSLTLLVLWLLRSQHPSPSCEFYWVLVWLIASNGHKLKPLWVYVTTLQHQLRWISLCPAAESLRTPNLHKGGIVPENVYIPNPSKVIRKDDQICSLVVHFSQNHETATSKNFSFLHGTWWKIVVLWPVDTDRTVRPKHTWVLNGNRH
jgi:hypothetical protein